MEDGIWNSMDFATVSSETLPYHPCNYLNFFRYLPLSVAMFDYILYFLQSFLIVILRTTQCFLMCPGRYHFPISSEQSFRLLLYF